jgi:hypothetical protein
MLFKNAVKKGLAFFQGLTVSIGFAKKCSGALLVKSARICCDKCEAFIKVSLEFFQEL